MAYKLITAPATEPVTLAEAKTHLNAVGTDDDTYITALIVAAREAAETVTERVLMTQTWELALDTFPDALELIRVPVQSVTSITYDDADGVATVLGASAYSLDTADDAGFAYIVPAYNTQWPVTQDSINAVRVRFVAGYASAAAVPQQVKQWILLRIGLLYKHREDVATGVSMAKVPYLDSLLDGCRIWTRGR